MHHNVQLSRCAIVFALAAALGLAVASEPALAADVTPPTQPGTITTSGLTSSAVTLSWTKSTDNVGIEGYRVYRGPAGASPAQLSLIATTDAVTRYSTTRLYSGTGYTFGIVAIDAANNKSTMRTIVVTTPASSDTTAPVEPSNASVSGRVFSSSRIDLVWANSSSSDAAGYQVFRDGTLIARVDLPNGLRYSDNGLAPSSSHVYVVRTVDSAGNVSAPTAGRTVKTLVTGALTVARGPYVSNVSGTSAVISWWTNLATAGAVSWGVSSSTEHVLTDHGPNIQHHALTISGLTPGTTYRYRVGNGGMLTSDATFATAPPPGRSFKFASIGDFGGGSTAETQNANNIAGAGTAFIQTVGDNIYPTSGLPDPDFTTVYSDFDARFYKPFAAAISNQAFFPANGNKEYYGDGKFWDNFPMPGSNHSFYSYDWGDAHILVLDTEQPVTPSSAQYQFAQGDLAAHQASTWRIVALQRPPYSSTSGNSSSKPVQANLVPLFQAEHVNLVLSGNSHNYERTFPLTGGVPAAGGITYVVTGGGGNGFNTFQLAQPAYSAFREDTFYEYVRVSISPASLVVDAIRADTNTVFDSTTITKSGAAPEPPGSPHATAAGATRIDLTWTASPSLGVASYRIYRDGGTTPIITLPASATSYSDTGLDPDTTYSYAVTAVDGTARESSRATVSATTAPAGGTVTVAASGDATIDPTGASTSGTSTRLTTDNSPVLNFLLRFSIPSTCSFYSAAQLTLMGSSASDAGSTKGGDFYVTADNGWTERTVTWDTAPAAGTLVGSLGAVTLNTAYSVNLDLSHVSIVPGTLSIRVSTTSGDAAKYVSMEGSATQGPQLALTC